MRTGGKRGRWGGFGIMVELLRTNDAVLMSFVQALLGDAGIDLVVLDGFTASVEGSLGAIPRRVMVADHHLMRARFILDDAEIPHEP